MARPLRPPPRRRRTLPVGRIARYDVDRERRTGAPEIVLAEGKRLADLTAILETLRSAGIGALVSRPTAAQRRAFRGRGPLGRLGLRPVAGPRLWALPGPRRARRNRGPIAVLTAGTADLAAAEESRAVLDAAGVEVLEEHDVGVAGLHRLLAAVARTERRRPLLYLAFAGREGALPTVLAGLVRAPVLGVPTSVGYGRGGRGEAALTAMLQSCAPVAVVNVDAAVPAALFALQLLAGRDRRASDTVR